MIKRKIYYHHTDCGGVVYYGEYLSFFEEARSEFFEGRGISIKSLSDSGVLFVVYRQELDYMAPVTYGETISISTAIVRVSTAKIFLENEIMNESGKTVCKGRTQLACVSVDLKPKPLPESVRAKLSEKQESV